MSATTLKHTSTERLQPLAPFDFAGTAYSHGWVVLAPNRWNAGTRTVQRQERLNDGTVVDLDISSAGDLHHPEVLVTIHSGSALSDAGREEIRRKLRWMFRMDEDLQAFYALCRSRGGNWRKVTRGLGRLLRSPDFFEDVVKTIFTTNIQWGGTKRMTAELVSAFGEPLPGDRNRKAFPTAEAIAAVSVDAFAGAVRMGYRAPYIHELASRIADGELDLESFTSSERPTPELKKTLLGIKGVGNYAAASLLMILGRYDDLAVDTVFRSFVEKKYFSGEYPGDAEARLIYDSWGEWKFLAYWFDLWEGPTETL